MKMRTITWKLGKTLIVGIVWLAMLYTIQTILGWLFIKFIVEGQTFYHWPFLCSTAVISIGAAYMIVRSLRNPWQALMERMPRSIQGTAHLVSSFLPTLALSFTLFKILSWASVVSWHFYSYHHNDWVLVSDVISGVISLALIRYIMHLRDSQHSVIVHTTKH